MSVQTEDQRRAQIRRGARMGWTSDTIVCRYCHKIIAVVARPLGDEWVPKPLDSVSMMWHRECRRVHKLIDAALE